MTAPNDLDLAIAKGFYVLEVLDSSGHLTLTWDPANPDEVAKAREEVKRLKEVGYTFYAVVGATGDDEVDAGNGTLIIQRIDDPICPPSVEPTEEEFPPEPGEELDPVSAFCSGTSKTTGQPCKRKAGKDGRCWGHPLEPKVEEVKGPYSPKTSSKTASKPKGRRSMAMRQMAGG